MENDTKELLEALCRLIAYSNGRLGKNPWAIPEWSNAVQAVGNVLGVKDKYAVDESPEFRKIVSTK